MATSTERGENLAAQQERISESRLLLQHERFCELVATLARSVHRWGAAVSETPAVEAQPRGSISRHTLDARVSLSALGAFVDAARVVDPSRRLLIGDRNRSLVLSILAAAAEPQAAVPAASRKRGRDTVGERVDRAIAAMDTSSSAVVLPDEHKARARGAVRALAELRAEDGAAPLESFALRLCEAPSPGLREGAPPRHALLLSARLAPGSVLRLSRLLACLPEPRDGHLACCNDEALGAQLPLGAHARVAVELGCVTLQLSCSLGPPFEERAAPS